MKRNGSGEKMSLIEYTLEGKINKVEQAIERVKLGALSPEPLYVCYSGGKDSKVLRRIVEMADVPHEFYYNLTTVDHPSVVREILDDKAIIVEKPRYKDGKQKTMWNLIVKKKCHLQDCADIVVPNLKKAVAKGEFV